MQYRPELIQKIIKYFAEHHNHFINEITVNEYLKSLGKLYVCLLRVIIIHWVSDDM